MNYYLLAFKNYNDFSGRAARAEYWMFAFFHFLFSMTAMKLDTILGTAIPGTFYGLLYMLYVLATFIPALAVATRRLHDTGRSGWYILLGFIPILGTIILIVLLAQEGERRQTAYGPEPEALVPTEAQELATQGRNDKILFGLLLWTLVMGIGFKLLYTTFQDHVFDLWVRKVTESLSVLGPYYGLVLASLIKDKALRLAATLTAGIYITYVICYDAVRMFVESSDLFL